MVPVPVTPPLVAVPTVVEVAIVAVVVPIRPIRAVGPARLIGTVRPVPVRTVGTTRLLRSRAVGPVPVRPVWAVGLFGTARTIRSVRTVRTIWRSRLVGAALIRTVRPLAAGSIRAVRLVRARRVRTSLIARTIWTTGPVGARLSFGTTFPARPLRAVRARTVGPGLGGLGTGCAWFVPALLRRRCLITTLGAALGAGRILGLGLPVLGQRRHGGERGQGEAGDGREHHQGTFHGLLPRTPRGAA